MYGVIATRTGNLKIKLTAPFALEQVEGGYTATLLGGIKVPGPGWFKLASTKNLGAIGPGPVPDYPGVALAYVTESMLAIGAFCFGLGVGADMATLAVLDEAGLTDNVAVPVPEPGPAGPTPDPIAVPVPVPEPARLPEG